MCRRFESSRGRQNRRSSVSVPADLHRISTRLLVPRRLLDQRDPGSRWSRGAPLFRWSSSAPRGTSRARVETPTKPPQTLTGSRHGRSSLTAYSINGCVGSRWSRGALLFRWSSSAPRGTSRARVETPTKPPQTLTGSRHSRSSLTAYSINGRVGSRWSRGALLFRWSSSAPRGTSRARVETPSKSQQTLTGSRHASSFLVGYSTSGCVVPLVE